MHGIAGVTGDLVQALASAHCLLYGILIVHYFIICKEERYMMPLGGKQALLQNQTKSELLLKSTSLNAWLHIVCPL